MIPTDICFIPDGDYAAFLERYLGRQFEEGVFLDENGNIIGRHRGAVRYTIGQRKGLGMGFGKPMFVQRKDMSANTVTLGSNEALFSRRVVIRDVNLIAADRIDRPLRVTAKVRYTQREEWATLHAVDENGMLLEFDNPHRAVAPGQAAVCYDGNCVVCGGSIVRGES